MAWRMIVRVNNKPDPIEPERSHRLIITQACLGLSGKAGNKSPQILKALIFRQENEGPIRRRACKPNSVEDGHSSRRAITGVLQRPTRRFPLHAGTSQRG